MIYLDHNATTPVDPAVTRACLPYLTEHFGNPGSGHPAGRAAAAAVGIARAAVAEVLGCAPAEVVFTGGGSEADTLAIRGAALAGRGRHVITQATEHPAVLAVCDALHRLHGYRVTRLPVDAHGTVDPAALAAAIDSDTVLVSVMHANNETGTVQPIRELAEIAHRHGALLHTDAAQSLGKLPLAGLGADLISVTGHKVYAPKGIGALYVRSGIPLEPTIYGGGQEGGRRAGTENVALIAGFGAACRLLDPATEAPRLRRLRDLLHEELAAGLPGRVHRNGHPADRLPSTLNASIDGAPGLLDRVPGIAASTGSACHEGRDEPSPVLTAMGLTAERARTALRLSVGRHTTPDEIHQAARALIEAART